MEPVAGVAFLKADFATEEGLAAVGKVYQSAFADLLTGPDTDTAKN